VDCSTVSNDSTIPRMLNKSDSHYGAAFSPNVCLLLFVVLVRGFLLLLMLS
jgi:hypothetical protein